MLRQLDAAAEAELLFIPSDVAQWRMKPKCLTDKTTTGQWSELAFPFNPHLPDGSSKLTLDLAISEFHYF